MSAETLPKFDLAFALPSLDQGLVTWWNDMFSNPDQPLSPTTSHRTIMRRSSSTDSLKKTVRFSLEVSSSEPDLTTMRRESTDRRLSRPQTWANRKQKK
ncbi:hypothetical protein GUITHDRAFT_150270 [Guillardia theta CCMP2712]|uniref:Uncharacterized protein n=1 Tax=Guillardia theta (strain CCMP2712) TaxID=905079 RepID=L1JZS8_GUITC|nr:hypothetical protein GUITHDRAFT_150270 [Guillardia theta CCMP2712]EKX53710.1 hypothetical protein GUITHDRAFT_150270 [Guillardia theta CCMP2712]|eukprot:XP_005840690.1 hypothetical protein GUITHDRAFT_150270 [Guillardia theta CCMP2712]